MIPYADLIRLHEPYRPVQGHADPDAVITALQQDANSAGFVQRYPIPDDQAQRRQWIQAALTIRPPGDLSDELCDAMDRLLQQELTDKHITQASDLPVLSLQGLENTAISIWDGDISTLQIGAVTNAANSQMLGCFQPFHACIDNVIQCAAGPQLREDCQRVIGYQGHDEATGDAKITRAYNLPADYVLHTVGPIIPDRRPTDFQAGQLANCYRNCLTVAADTGVRSLAFCGISTGVFGYPPAQAAEVALRAVFDWLRANPGRIDHVVFNTYGAETTAIYNTAIGHYV